MNFDDDQQKVVGHINGAMLVVAGAGSGKTATIIGRAGRLIESGISPGKHLMLTFSRKAADEMRERIGKLVHGVDLSRMIIGTYHSFGYRLIREEPVLCQRRPGVTMLDEKDVDGLLKSISEDINIDIEKEEGKGLISKLYGVYSFACNELLSIDNSRDGNRIDTLLDKAGVSSGQIKSAFFEIFRRYEQKKRENNVVDFDDLLVLPVRGLLSGIPGQQWAAKLSRRFEYITVDEAQDTNFAQYRLVGLIATHGNVVMVGDDDQSIYSWRGANPNNMPSFRNQLKAKVVFLPRNYRSTQAIIESAAQHVSKNSARFDKTPYAVQVGGEPINLLMRESSRQATWEIVNSISDYLASGGEPKDVAILYRVNRLSRLLEYALLSAGIPYRVVGGINFEQRAEIRLAIAIARLVVNEADETAFLTACEYVPGVGKSSIEKIVDAANSTKSSFFWSGAKISTKAQQGINKLLGVVDFLRNIGGPTALVDQMLDANGLSVLDHFAKKDKKETITTRSRNLEMLRLMLEEWTSQAEDDQSPWEVFFEKIVGSQAESASESNRVTLSTIHRSKGLEWGMVHVLGFSEGILPLIRQNRGSESSADEEDDVVAADIEEERRLSYVAITRAKRFCSLWHCNEYDYGYERKTYALSRFAGELCIEVQAEETDAAW